MANLTTLSRPDCDNQLRMAAYEVLNTFVTNAAGDTLPIVAELSDVVLQRLENTIPMQEQVVSVEDRITVEEIQTSLASALLVGTHTTIILSIAKTNVGYRTTIGSRHQTTSR